MSLYGESGETLLTNDQIGDVVGIRDGRASAQFLRHFDVVILGRKLDARTIYSRD